MHPIKIKIVVAGLLAIAVAGTAAAQMAGNPGTSGYARAMPGNFVHMQQMMNQARNTGNWNERMRLMQSHMQLMRQQMGNVMGMMGMSAMPGQRMGNGMMRGGGMGTPRPGYGNAASGDLQAQMAAMQARMREMTRLMQQMMEQQQLMLQKMTGQGKGG